MVCTFVERYNKLSAFTDQELDKLNKEFLDYKALSRDAIPEEVWDDALWYEIDEDSEKRRFYRMDNFRLLA